MAGYPIPGDTAPPPSGGIPPFDPVHGEYSLWPLNPAKPIVDVGDTGDAVRYVQAVVMRNHRHAWHNLHVDGEYGTETRAAVEYFQGVHGLPVDGVVGPATWAVVDRVAGS